MRPPFLFLCLLLLALSACTSTADIKDELAYGRTCQENGFPWGSAEYNFCIKMLKEKQHANGTTPPTAWIPDIQNKKK